MARRLLGHPTDDAPIVRSDLYRRADLYRPPPDDADFAATARNDGTTALRLLESASEENGSIRPFRGLTDLFLLPGHRFRTADLLMTNFHLPKSTLFMLVCAFAGTDTMKRAYAHAIKSGYRFYSYGDASLLFRAP